MDVYGHKSEDTELLSDSLAGGKASPAWPAARVAIIRDHAVTESNLPNCLHKHSTQTMKA